MNAEQKYYVKKKVKQGKDYVLKDVEIYLRTIESKEQVEYTVTKTQVE
jgi:outer membrane protein assembly factor BamA